MLRSRYRHRDRGGGGGGIGVVGSGATIDPSILPPSLALANANPATNPPTFNIASLGDAIVGDTLRLARYNDDALTAGLVTYDHLITQADVDQAAPRPITFTGVSGITTGTYRWVVYIVRGSVRSISSGSVTSGPDDVPAVVSAQAISGIGSTGATLNFTSNEAGTYFIVLTAANVMPSVTQVATGKDSTGAAAAKALTAAMTSGANAVPATGLASSTAFYGWLVADDATSNRTPAVLSLGTFTTAAAASTFSTDPAQYRNPGYLAFSNGQLTCTNTGGGSGNARGATTHSGSEKWVVRAVVDANGGLFYQWAFGVCNGLGSIGNASGVSDTYGVSYQIDGVIIYNGGNSTSGYAALVAGDALIMAVDEGAALVWFGKQTGGTGSIAWQNGDPTVPTGGKTIAGLTGTRRFEFNANGTGCKATLSTYSLAGYPGVG